MNRRNMWTGRMMLELSRHRSACFTTLTFKDAPDSLNPADMRDFLKRLRYYIDRPLRYYGVGEYGSKGGRPHYHLALFGVCMSEQSVIEKAWPFGFVHVGELNAYSAQYLTKYVAKSWVQLQRHDGKHPEFARMSRNPALGAPALDDIAGNLMLAHGGSIEQEDIGDVPSVMRNSGRRYPIGRVLRGKLREAIGWENNAPAAVVKALSDEAARRTVEEKELRERRRVASYENLSGRLRIQALKEKL